MIRKDLLTAIIEETKTVAKVEIQEITMDVGVDAPLHLHPCPTMGVVTEGWKMFEELEKINKRPEPFQYYTAGDLWTDEHTLHKPELPGI